MHSETAKQYLPIEGKPVLCYSLEVFQKSPVIDGIVLVTGAEDLEYCRSRIVERYGFGKVRLIVPGGAERSDSVYAGLKACPPCDYVFIHDGARPFVTDEILLRALCGARQHGACVVGMPVKDTIKVADADGFCAATPDRRLLWQVQTPQVFSAGLIRTAYQKLMEAREKGEEFPVTDDAMVAERMMDIRVKLVEGAYSNIKITTPEDLALAKALVSDS